MGFFGGGPMKGYTTNLVQGSEKDNGKENGNYCNGLRV